MEPGEPADIGGVCAARGDLVWTGVDFALLDEANGTIELIAGETEEAVLSLLVFVAGPKSFILYVPSPLATDGDGTEEGGKCMGEPDSLCPSGLIMLFTWDEATSRSTEGDVMGVEVEDDERPAIGVCLVTVDTSSGRDESSPNRRELRPRPDPGRLMFPRVRAAESTVAVGDGGFDK